ncbi:MAG: CoA-transferase, partial [Christensenellales bacterium]
YRKAVQSGLVKANEHSCYTLISGLRAAAAGLPFMPVFGLKEGQLLEVCDYFKRIPDPFSGEMVTVVRAYRPDVSILHVDEADETGNARIEGALYDDILLSRASKQLIVSAERIVPSSKFKFSQQKAQIPGFMVSAVVHMPKGAAPGAFSPAYDLDKKRLHAFLSIQDKNELMDWVDQSSAHSFAVGRWS